MTSFGITKRLFHDNIFPQPLGLGKSHETKMMTAQLDNFNRENSAVNLFPTPAHHTGNVPTHPFLSHTDRPDMGKYSSPVKK